MWPRTSSRRANEITDPSFALLRAASLPEASPAAAAWKAFREMVPEGQEPPRFLRLLPLVCRNLSRRGHSRDPYLVHAYAQCLGFNARALETLGRAVHALNAHSIPNLVLKGSALLLAHYRDRGIRPMSDVDLLVPSDRIDGALDALQGSGFQGDPARRWLEGPMHAGTLSNHSEFTLDLHRYATYEARYPEANDAFFEASVPLEVEGEATRALGPSDQLLHTIVHGLRWSVAPSDIWIVDAATIIRGGGVDPDLLVSRARRLRLSVPLREGLRLVRSVLDPEPKLDALVSALPNGRLGERIEHWFRVRPPAGVMGALPNLWFAFQRSRSGGAPLRDFPSFLATTWGVPLRALPRQFLRKALKRLTRSEPRERAPS